MCIRMSVRGRSNLMSDGCHIIMNEWIDAFMVSNPFPPEMSRRLRKWNVDQEIPNV